MHDSDTLAGYLETLERELLTPDVRRSARVDELLADDFVEFGSSGRAYTKAAIVASLHGEAPTALTASGFRLRMLAPDVALLTYRSRRHGEPDFHALRSSIWRRDGDAWRMVFHQGTPTTPEDPA